MSTKALAVVLVGLSLLSPVGPALAVTSPEETAARLVNETRDARDLRVLDLARRLSRYAERQAMRMARQRRLFHSSLDISGYSALGEIVGTADTVRRVHRAFLRSRAHRRIMLGRWQLLGVGVVRRGGRVYVAQIYAR